jgi:hypothetical protein
MARCLPLVLILFRVTRSLEDCSFQSSYPKQYLAYKTSQPIHIDGLLNEDDWENSLWSDRFVDISTSTLPLYATQIKILWDSSFLYIAAQLIEPSLCGNITSTCHCIDEINDQIIFHDNDFEVFVDPDGDNHHYKEFEMNAWNATWDLLLNKPYSDGGYENSSRIYGSEGYDMLPYLQCAVYLNGTINSSEGSDDQFWSVEIALPLEALVEKELITLPPKNNSLWRINFSRVEWNTILSQDGKYLKQPSCQSCPIPGTEAEDNWVWSPQGEINMHAPEKWGMLQLVDLFPTHHSPSSSTWMDPNFLVNPEWPVRSVAMILYYAERGYYADYGVYTSDLKILDEYATEPILSTGQCSEMPVIELKDDGRAGYLARVTDLAQGYQAEIREDRLLIVTKRPIL